MYLHCELSDLCFVRKKKKKNDVFCQYIISVFKDVKNLRKGLFSEFLQLKIKMMYYFDKQCTKV